MNNGCEKDMDKTVPGLCDYGESDKNMDGDTIFEHKQVPKVMDKVLGCVRGNGSKGNGRS